MDHPDGRSRLRSPLAISRGHRATIVAAACVGALAVPAAGVVAARAAGGEPAVVRPAQVDDLACTGPPPFAGQIPEGETKAERAANRRVEVVAFALWRAANCPLADDPVDSSLPDDDGCTGAPEFAGTPAEPADPKASVVPSPRADEAQAHADERSACHETTSTTEALAASVDPGVPASVPAGPPDSIPAGPPAGLPPGPPDGVPAGPPASTPGGPPEDVGGDPPVSTPVGAPPDVPAGPPVSTPAGPPEGVPAAPGNG